ncbi:MAG: TolC family outer membrane protein [Pseudomonadota bacterium]
MQKSLTAVLIAGACLSFQAQAADLIQVYQQALANDATFASARAALAAAQERMPQGRSQLLPTVGLSGSYSQSNTDVQPYNEGQIGLTQTGGLGVITGVDTSSRNKSYSLALSQPLFRWDRWETYEQSRLAQSIGEAQFAQAQQDLITRVAQAYFDVLAAQDTLESTRAQKSATTEQLASAKRNFEVGTQTITDTHEAQAAYDQVVAQEFAAINDLDNKRAALQSIIGGVPETLAPLKAGVSLAAPEPAAIDAWVGAAEKQNYGVLASTLALESSKRDIKKSRAGHLPTLDLVSSVGRSSGTAQNNVLSKSIGVQWNVPLFNGFAITSKVRESIALEDKAKNDLEATRRAAALGARQAFLGVNSGLAQVKALEAAEVSSQSSLESNKLGYQVGVRINIDVLNAQRLLYSTRTTLAKARYDTIVNGLRLKAASGSLKEADLAPVNGLLQK